MTSLFNITLKIKNVFRHFRIKNPTVAPQCCLYSGLFLTLKVVYLGLSTTGPTSCVTESTFGNFTRREMAKKFRYGSLFQVSLSKLNSLLKYHPCN